MKERGWKERARERKKAEFSDGEEICRRFAAKFGGTPEEQQEYFKQCSIGWGQLPQELKKRLEVTCAVQASTPEDQEACLGAWALRPIDQVEAFAAKMLEGVQNCADEMQKARDSTEMRKFGAYCFSLLKAPLSEPYPQIRLDTDPQETQSPLVTDDVPLESLQKELRLTPSKGKASYKERILSVPFHPAKRKNYCTVASLHMVLDYFGIAPLPGQDVLHEHCPYFEACDVNPLAQYGLNARKIHLKQGAPALIQELNRGLPVILRIMNPRTHSVVFIGVEHLPTGDVNFIYHDPAFRDGPSKIRQEVLLAQWGRTGDYAMVFQPPEGISVAKMDYPVLLGRQQQEQKKQREELDKTRTDFPSKTSEALICVPDAAPFKIPWNSVVPNIEALIPGQIYVYNHYETLKLIYRMFRVDEMLRRQLQALPKLLLLLVEGAPVDTIIVIDPIGEADPVAAEYIKDFFRPNYRVILRSFIAEAKAIAFDDVDLRNYCIKVCISHLHPDHWRGLPILLEALQDIVRNDERLYPLGKVEVFVPNNYQTILRAYSEKFVGRENQYLSEKMKWDPALIKGIREVCDLYYGKWQDPAVFPENIKLIPIIHKKQYGPFHFLSTKKTHGGVVVLIFFNWAGDRYVLLDDLFPPAYTLTTSYPPYASYINVVETYHTHFQLEDRCLWSHHYRSLGGRRHGRLVSKYGGAISNEFKDFETLVTRYFKAYIRIRNGVARKAKGEVHRDAFDEWVGDRDVLKILITNLLHMGLDRTGNVVEQAVSLILDDIECISRWLSYPSARVDIIEQSFQEELRRQKAHDPEGDFDSILTEDYGMMFEIMMTSVSQLNGVKPVIIKPNRFQSAMLIISFLINVLEYCEQEYHRR